MFNKTGIFIKRSALMLVSAMLCSARLSAESGPAIDYRTTKPPLQVEFTLLGGHYNGKVSDANLFLQPDIHQPPLITYTSAQSDKFYLLIMMDLGNASGSWPDPVPAGKNAPLRHWVVGNIPGSILADGYHESAASADLVDRLQPYRYPHIPLVSDRYGLYLFEQNRKIDFEPMTGSIINFDYQAFLKKYNLAEPKASNWFVAIYLSDSPFSGKPFHGNDVSENWLKNHGEGGLAPASFNLKSDH